MLTTADATQEVGIGAGVDLSCMMACHNGKMLACAVAGVGDTGVRWAFVAGLRQLGWSWAWGKGWIRAEHNCRTWALVWGVRSVAVGCAPPKP